MPIHKILGGRDRILRIYFRIAGAQGRDFLSTRPCRIFCFVGKLDFCGDHSPTVNRKACARHKRHRQHHDKGRYRS
jgi:hypothetical protein